MTGEVRGLSRPWSERTELRFREICSGWQHRRQGRGGRPGSTLGAAATTHPPSRGTRGRLKSSFQVRDHKGTWAQGT